jgi:hypothetical protein
MFILVLVVGRGALVRGLRSDSVGSRCVGNNTADGGVWMDVCAEDDIGSRRLRCFSSSTVPGRSAEPTLHGCGVFFLERRRGLSCAANTTCNTCTVCHAACQLL